MALLSCTSSNCQHLKGCAVCGEKFGVVLEVEQDTRQWRLAMDVGLAECSSMGCDRRACKPVMFPGLLGCGVATCGAQ